MADTPKCDKGQTKKDEKGNTEKADKGPQIKKGTMGPSCGSKSPTAEPPVPKKPQLRGLHMLQTRNHMIVALALATVIGAGFKFLVANPKKTQYAEYYRCTDMEELFEEMRSNGLFQGAPK